MVVFERNPEEIAEAVERFGWTHSAWNSPAGFGKRIEKFNRFIETVYAAGATYTFAVEWCIVRNQW